jgi:hypothetical protein
MSKLKSVSLYDVYKLEGEDKAMAVKKLLAMSESINELGDTYIAFADNNKNIESLEEERKLYIAEQIKREEGFTISLPAYVFLRFGATLEAKLDELINNINTKIDANETK